MHPRRAAAVVLIWLCLMSPSLTRAQTTESIRPAVLPLSNVMNTSDDPAKFKPAALKVELSQFIALPNSATAVDFEDLRQWLTDQGFVIVRAIGPQPWRADSEIRFSGNVKHFNEAFHVKVMERSAGSPKCYAVFTNPMLPAHFAAKNAKVIEGYSLNADGAGVGPSCD